MPRRLITDHDPDDQLKYSFDFAAWLANEGTTAASYAITATTGGTVGTATLNAGVVTAMLSATQTATFACVLTDSAGQKFTLTHVLRVANQ